MSVKDALEALWIAFARGSSCDRYRHGNRPARRDIGLDWHELVPVEAKDETDEVRRGLLGDGYRDVLFPAKPLRGFWRRPEERPRPAFR